MDISDANISVDANYGYNVKLSSEEPVVKTVTISTNTASTYGYYNYNQIGFKVDGGAWTIIDMNKTYTLEVESVLYFGTSAENAVDIASASHGVNQPVMDGWRMVVTLEDYGTFYWYTSRQSSSNNLLINVDGNLDITMYEHT